jgi:hypothetical protein
VADLALVGDGRDSNALGISASDADNQWVEEADGDTFARLRFSHTDPLISVMLRWA